MSFSPVPSSGLYTVISLVRSICALFRCKLKINLYVLVVQLTVQLSRSGFSFLAQGLVVQLRVQLFSSGFSCLAQGLVVQLRVQLSSSGFSFLAQGLVVQLRVQLSSSGFSCLVQGLVVQLRVQLSSSGFSCLAQGLVVQLRISSYLYLISKIFRFSIRTFFPLPTFLGLIRLVSVPSGHLDELSHF